jgi:uncharacterized protein
VPFSVYDVTVPVMSHGLNVLDDYLEYARSLAAGRGQPVSTVLEARLAPDMLSFAEQISVLCNKVDLHMAKMLRRDIPHAKDTPAEIPALKARLAETIRFLESIAEGDLAGAETHTFELSPPIVRGWFGGQDYVLMLVLPDFFFHVATAHDILRHLGGPVGKRTYLGRLSQESGGAYS